MEEINFNTGIILDTRPEEEKRDFHFAETSATFEEVKWVRKSPSEWRTFPKSDQKGSGSCVAQTIRKMAGIHYWLETKEYFDFSATHIYQRRSNKPDGGMMASEAFQFLSDGITLNAFAPSDRMSDAEMDNYKISERGLGVGKAFGLGNPQPIVLPARDIEAVASVIQRTGKPVMVWFWFANSKSGRAYEDWWRPIPQAIDGIEFSDSDKHSVTATDFFLNENNEKCLVLNDSAGVTTGVDGGHNRIITETYFKKRNFYSAYVMNFKSSPQDDKPRHTFTQPLQFSDVVTYNNPDVVALQKILQYEGLFPSNINPTGYYGNITADAVDKFQRKHNVAPPAELDKLRGKRVGEKTIAFLNNNYGNQ